MVDISIIIPTFNRNEIANNCIASILDCSLTNIEIIVVNDSKDNNFVLDTKNISNLITIHNNPKQGVASARNLGASKAKSAKLLFVDDDMILNKDAILSAIKFLKTNPNCTYNANWIYDEKLIDIISKQQFGRYLIANNFTSLKGWNNDEFEWKENSLLKANGITSQFFAINKIVFDSLGGYNENFPHAGFEDYEFYHRMQKNKITNYIDTSVMIFHNELDRLDPINWLKRKKRGAKTRKVAFNMEFNELKLEYSFVKKTILSLLSFSKPLIHLTLKLIPSNKFFDLIYFKYINLLIAINIFEGYCKE